MKILVIPDLHGNDIWEKIIEQEINNVDKIIFLGDYVDSYHLSDDKILLNLRNVITFKIRNKDKVELLLGNHDIQYLYSYKEYGCSGYRPSMYIKLNNLYNKYKDLFKICHQEKNWLFSHAGLSERFYNCFINKLKLIIKQEPDFDKVADNINSSLENKLLFDICAFVGKSRGGWNNFGGIFWADKDELYWEALQDYNQVVGHTAIKEKEKHGNVLFIDTYNKGNYEHYIIEIE